MTITLQLINNALQFSQNGITLAPGDRSSIDLSPGKTAIYGGRKVTVEGTFRPGVTYELCGDQVSFKDKKFFELKTGLQVGFLR